MASAKKGKKSKGVTLSLQEFTAKVDGEVKSGQNVVYAPSAKAFTSSWADEMEEDEMEKIILPSAPRASRGPAYEDSQIPKVPPFQANIGNLHYDIDDEDVYKFFRDLEVKDLKLPRDQISNRIKGFGFVIFETRQDLIDALTMNDQMLRGRPVRISLLNKDDPMQRGGDGGPRGRMRAPAEDEGVDNWRSMSQPVSSVVGMGGGGGFDGGRRGFDRGPPSGGSFDRFDRGDRFDRRYQHAPPPPSYPPQRRDYGPPPPPLQRPSNYDLEEEEHWRRPVVPRPPPPVMRSERDRHDSHGRGHGPAEPPARVGSPPVSEPEGMEEAPAPAPPKERKKLVLQPRTKPIGVTNEEVSRPTSIFGDAKPVDTKAREEEILEKKEHRPASTPSGSIKQDDRDSHSEPEDDRDLRRYYPEDSQSQPKGRYHAKSRGGGEGRRGGRPQQPMGRYGNDGGGRSQQPPPHRVDKDGWRSSSSTMKHVTTPTQEEPEEMTQMTNKFAALCEDD